MELQTAYESILAKLQTWINTFIEMLPNLMVALIVLVIFYFIGKMVRKAVNKVLRRTTDNKTIIHLMETLSVILMVIVGLIIALGVLKLDGTVKSLLAGAGIIGLALGFAFQDVASNFIAGVFLAIRHPFGIGDIIQTNGYYGTVRKLNLRNTILKTTTGQVVYIPNKSVFENPLENFTKGAERRVDLECGVSYGDDLEKARDLAVEAVESLDCYDKNREVEFFYEEYGESSINFVIRFWIVFRKNQEYWEARHQAIMAIKKNFDEHDIMIPFPIRTLDFGIRGGEPLNAMLGSKANGGSA